jgi:hypothetical protein
MQYPFPHKGNLGYHFMFLFKSMSPTRVNIRRTVVDEGASMCVMSLSCWKGLGFLNIVPSQSMLKAFDGHVFKPHGIVPAFPVTLGGKTMNVEVEVVDAPIDYNLLLVQSWTYAMEVVPFSYFRCIKFPHEGKLVTIDQLSFYNAPNESGTAALFVNNSTPACENMVVSLYSSLMGSFNISSPILMVNSFPIYAFTQVARDQGFLERSFKTTYLSYPWTLPKSNTLVNEDGIMGMDSPLSTVDVAYNTIQEKIAGECSSSLAEEERNIYPLPVLSMCSSSGSDPLDTELFTDETIMEVMCPIEKLWEISHHRSLFISTIDQLKRFDLKLTIRKECDWFKNLFSMQPVFVEGNLSNISATIPINISSNTKVTKNIMIEVDCSPEEIQIYITLFKEYRGIFA